MPASPGKLQSILYSYQEIAHLSTFQDTLFYIQYFTVVILVTQLLRKQRRKKKRHFSVSLDGINLTAYVKKVCKEFIENRLSSYLTTCLRALHNSSNFTCLFCNFPINENNIYFTGVRTINYHEELESKTEDNLINL